MELGKKKGLYGVVGMNNMYAYGSTDMWETCVWKKENECFKVHNRSLYKTSCSL